jgi:nucleoside-diphosphate-sugar epimerase
MKALVTGAAGFIGSYLVETLKKRGYEVTCLTRRSSNLKWIEHLDLKYIFCDLSEVESSADEINGFDYVFHLAGVTKALCERDFFHVNADCTEKFLRVIAEKNPGLQRFLYLSSLAATGPSGSSETVREDSPPSPVSSYGKSKLQGEKAVLEYGSKFPVTIIRPPAVYGPRDTDFFVMFKMIKKGFFPFWGKCFYSLLYVEDLVQGIILAAESKEAEGETFFLSDNMVYTNEAIAAEISSAIGVKAMKIRLPQLLLPFLAFLGQKIDKRGIINRDRINDFRYPNWTCDSSKARDELGFRSRITLREGIKWTADWYRIHRWL